MLHLFPHKRDQVSNSKMKRNMIKSMFTCSTETLPYVLTCSGYGDLCICQTSMRLLHRYTFHKMQIRQPQYRHLKVSEQIEKCTRNLVPNFNVFFLLFIFSNTKVLPRLNRYAMFINIYRLHLNMNH